MLAQFGIAFCTLFDELNPLMQDLPDDAAEPIGDGPNGRLIAQSRQQTPEHRLEITAFLPGRSVGRLVQHPPQVFVPLAERLLRFSSALSSFPGQFPTQEVNCAAAGNVLACTPTSASRRNVEVLRRSAILNPRHHVL